MSQLLLVRHGESDHNREHRFQGQSNLGLNKHGVAQAQALRDRLAEVGFTTILCSDLQRAEQTAEVIAEQHEVEVIPDPVLREMDFGKWEGLTYVEIEEKYPRELADWREDIANHPPLGGETLDDFTDRVRRPLDDIMGGCMQEKVLIVSHGGVLQVMCCLALGLSPSSYWQFRIELASISAMSIYPQGVILNRLNDTGHLEKLKWGK
ncbi:MAG: alpha-ribazole phosphatase [Anaerolineales bacterium]|jgi:alpha-ribazole phosphatase